MGIDTFLFPLLPPVGGEHPEVRLWWRQLVAHANVYYHLTSWLRSFMKPDDYLFDRHVHETGKPSNFLEDWYEGGLHCKDVCYSLYCKRIDERFWPVVVSDNGMEVAAPPKDGWTRHTLGEYPPHWNEDEKQMAFVLQKLLLCSSVLCDGFERSEPMYRNYTYYWKHGHRLNYELLVEQLCCEVIIQLQLPVKTEPDLLIQPTQQPVQDSLFPEKPGN